MVTGSPQPMINLDPVLMSSPGVQSAAMLRDQLTSASPALPPPGEPTDSSSAPNLHSQPSGDALEHEVLATAVDDNEEELTMTQGAADCEFYDPAAIEVGSPAEGAGVEDEFLSRVGSEENYSTRPAPSSMAAPSVTFSLAEGSDMGDSVSMRDQEIAEIPQTSDAIHALNALQAAEGPTGLEGSLLASVEKQDGSEGEGIVMSSTPPPRFGYDHGTDPIQTYKTRETDNSSACMQADFTDQKNQQADDQRALAPVDTRKMEVSDETVTEAKAEEALMEYENERMRLTSTKIKGLVGLFFNILFWSGLYIGLNFAPK